MTTNLWITKQGATGRPLLLGLMVADALIDFADLTTPVLRIRRKTSALAAALEFVVTSYTDTFNTPALYNAQVVFTDWSDLTQGEYIADVVADYEGELTMWPDDSYIGIRILQGVAEV